MIEDVATFDQLLAPGIAERVGVLVHATDIPSGVQHAFEQVGVRVNEGRALVSSGRILPVVGGKTCSAALLEYDISKYPDLLVASPMHVGEIRNALVVVGNTNHYHFFSNHLPGLMLANAVSGPTVSIVLGMPFPPRVAGLMGRLLPHLVGGRPVQIVEVAHGSYDLHDAIFPIRAQLSMAAHIGRNVVAPFVLAEAGKENTLSGGSPRKLFVRRQGAANGRSLLNQKELEAWFAARGFVGVDPGALSIEEQIILFAGATHVVGVEGAAMTNIIFAPHLKQVVMMASAHTRGEIFFQGLIRRYAVPFHTLYGQPLDLVRNADYLIPMSTIDTLPPEATAD